MRITITFMLSLALVLGGCAQQDQTAGQAPGNEPAAEAAELSAEQLGELGAQISNEPDRAEEILSARGLSQESFEAAIREVTEDPEASKRYAEAFNRARA